MFLLLFISQTIENLADDIEIGNFSVVFRVFCVGSRFFNNGVIQPIL